MLGLKHELASLLICIGIGYIVGIISICIGTEGDWPTTEMRNRGVINSLAIGFAVAIPSGIGVALSVLGNNNSSLVGVAISVSLLPPAVNCGIAFAYACFGFPFDSGALDDDNNMYSDAYSYFKLGGVSLCLTLINIGAIYISALMMFHVKEVAPISTQTAFWQEDIQRSRGWNDVGSAPSFPSMTGGDAQSGGDLEAQQPPDAEDKTAASSKVAGLASIRPAALELQSFETNPILQEEFLRSSIGNEVMSAEPLALAMNPVAAIARSSTTSGNRSPSKRLLNVLRQGSLGSIDGGSDKGSEDSGSEAVAMARQASPVKRTMQRASSSVTSSPAVSDYNTATPSSVHNEGSPSPRGRPMSAGTRPTMRRGSLSKSAQSVLGAILAERSDEDILMMGGDINIDEIKERLRCDAQLLSAGQVIEDGDEDGIEGSSIMGHEKSKDI
jgi:hypothetical protein